MSDEPPNEVKIPKITKMPGPRALASVRALDSVFFERLRLLASEVVYDHNREIFDAFIHELVATALSAIAVRDALSKTGSVPKAH